MSISGSLIDNLSSASTAAGSIKATCSPGISTTAFPQSPISPPLMSVGAQNYASNFAHSHTSPSHPTTSNGQPLSSPTSSTPMSTQNSQQPTVSVATSFPTPASSVSGQLRNTTPADESESADKSWGTGVMQTSHVSGNMDYDSQHDRSGHKRTDHDRQTSTNHSIDRNGQPAGVDVEMMDLDPKPEDLINRDLSLDALQQDVGTAFHLCKSGKAFFFSSS